MATLVLTVGASTDDARLSDTGYDDTETAMQVGGTGTTTANFGQGWRFTSVTLTGADTVTSAVLSLMKSSTQFSQRDMRLAVEDADNSATFSSGSAPGSRAIVSGTIPAESPNTNETDGTRYDIPSGSTEQGQLGTLIDAVISRGGWATGNAISIINNSDQDASANTGFGRKAFHTWDSATSSSEPTLTITYTPGGPTINTQPSDASIYEGETASFTVSATASAGSLTYQWKVDTGGGFSNVSDGSGGTSATHTTGVKLRASNGNDYKCTVTDSNGSLDSNTVNLEVKLVGRSSWLKF